MCCAPPAPRLVTWMQFRNFGWCVKCRRNWKQLVLGFFFFFFFLWGGGIPPSALQPFEAYCANPAFSSPRSSPEALHVRRRERPISERRNYGARNGRSNLAEQCDFHVIVGFFNIPQSCDMGQTAVQFWGLAQRLISCMTKKAFIKCMCMFFLGKWNWSCTVTFESNTL
jgi:hypothetical protein